MELTQDISVSSDGGEKTKRQRRPKNNTPLFAALDLGTNSCRMLIARPNGLEFDVVDAFSKTVYLGQGLDASGKLSSSAIRRAISALQVCAKKLNTHNVQNMRLIATASCRQARNGRQFVDQAQKRTGLRLKIVKPEEEARLAVVGCAAHLRTSTEQVLVVDIGGGSTELIWLDLTAVAPEHRRAALMQMRSNLRHPKSDECCKVKVLDWISVPFGVSTLREQFSDIDEDKSRFAMMSWFFEEYIEEFGPVDPTDKDKFQIIATSGTVTTIASTFRRLDVYDRSKVDGFSMTSGEIDKEITRYLQMGPKGREKAACIGKGRKELIMSGSAILQAILRVWPTECLTIADRGLREGLLVSQMSRAGYLS